MKLPRLGKKRNWNYLALAFWLPAGVMLALLFVTSASPFGEYSMLYSDMYHQYFPFFKAFRQALRSGESLLWNWSAGMGMDYLGLVSYYLASPLNLLSVLVPDGWELGYFSMLMPLKLGFAGLFFAYMLKKLFGRDDLSITLFGAMYAMCAWALGYQWNIMWLDSFALLPLVALGTVQLLRDKKFILYTLALFLSIFSNYYVGFFVCIFVLLLFFCYEICRFRSVGRFLLDLGRIALFSLLAIGMTAVLELPALASLQNSSSSVNQFPEGFSVNLVSGEAVNAAREAWAAYRTAREAGEGGLWGLLWTALKSSVGPLTEAMILVSGQIGGGSSLTHMDGSPNLYCGVLPIALGFLFLLARDVKLRDKLCCVFLLMFFMLSFIIRQLDYIWHGFHFTNQIPYRFSFLFSFVLLYIAYRAWLLRDRFKLWQLVTAGVLSVCLVLLYEEKRTDPLYLAFNLAFLGLYFTALLFGQKELVEEPAPEPEPELPTGELPEEAATEALSEEPHQPEAAENAPSWLDRIPSHETRLRWSALGVAAIIVLELALNLVSFVSGFGPWKYDYPENGEAVSSMLAVVDELENDKNQFYRLEMTHAQTLNDGPLNGYNGISTFSSSANVNVTRFTKALGASAYDTWNRYCYEDGSPVSNLFLNLKYMIDRKNSSGENAYFDQLHTYENVTLLKNNAWLPLGFLANAKLETLEWSDSGGFIFQDQLFSAATGLSEEVWDLVNDRDVAVKGDNVTLKLTNVSGYTSFEAGANGGSVTYTYTVTQAGFMCLDMNLYRNGRVFHVKHNGVKLYEDTYTLPQMAAVCSVEPGDTVEIIAMCDSSESSSVSIRAAILNDEVFRRGYDILNASTLYLTEFSTDYISGDITCDRDGLLYTSIPQNGSWKARVDGVEVEATLVGGTMVALHLTEGTHTVEFYYDSQAFNIGLLVSLGCGVTFGGIILGQYLWRRRKKRQPEQA